MNEQDIKELRRLDILESLKPLFKEAQEKNLWFQGNYQCIWFSPPELVAQHLTGLYVWGPENWRLADPFEHLQRLEHARNSAQNEVDKFKLRLIAHRML